MGYLGILLSYTKAIFYLHKGDYRFDFRVQGLGLRVWDKGVGCGFRGLGLGCKDFRFGVLFWSCMKEGSKGLTCRRVLQQQASNPNSIPTRCFESFRDVDLPVGLQVRSRVVGA